MSRSTSRPSPCCSTRRAQLTVSRRSERRALLSSARHFQLERLLAVQPEVLTRVEAALHRLRASPRPPAHRVRGDRRRGLRDVAAPPPMSSTLGLGLALASALRAQRGLPRAAGRARALLAADGAAPAGVAARAAREHAAGRSASPSASAAGRSTSPRSRWRRSRSCRRSRPAGSAILALLVHSAVATLRGTGATGGSSGPGRGRAVRGLARRRSETAGIAAWPLTTARMARLLALAAALAACDARRALSPGAAGTRARCRHALCRRRRRDQGGRRPAAPRLRSLLAQAIAFICLQFGFQRGGAVATAGTDATPDRVPIAPDSSLFHEGLPGGRARRSPPCRVLPRHRRCGAPCSSGSLTGFAASARARPSQSSA